MDVGQCQDQQTQHQQHDSKQHGERQVGACVVFVRGNQQQESPDQPNGAARREKPKQGDAGEKQAQRQPFETIR